MKITINDLVGKYVRAKSDFGCGAPLVGLFFATCAEDPARAHVFDFVSRRKVLVAINNCSVIEVWNMVGGFVGLTANVPDFGEGVVYREFVEGSALVLRLRNERSHTVRACISSVEVIVPK